MAKLSAPSGFRDFLPDAFRKRSELIRRIREVYESFGFEGMETPCMENLAVFLGKGGGENEKLMYRVMKRAESLQRALDKGDELADMGLRFDLTVPLARYYATHRHELPAVFKRYQIGPVWRAERAQHGRYREFIQCDVDVLGSTSMMVEAEVITATAAALAKLGFTGLRVRFNSRPLLQGIVRGAGVPEEKIGETIISLDKLEKIGPDGVRKELEERGVSGDAASKLLDFQQAVREFDTAGKLAELGKQLDDSAAGSLADIRAIFELTPELPSGELDFDPFLARGLDYYTGPIFEVASEGVPFSLAGGGRFDGLIGKLSGQDVPACGFSIGFERVYTLMDERNMFDASTRAADVFVALPSEDLAKEAMRLGSVLRDAGLRAEVHPQKMKIVKQYGLAEKKGITYAVIPNAEAAARGEAIVRDLKKRENTNVPEKELAVWLESRL